MDIECRPTPTHPPGSPEADRLAQEHGRDRERRWAAEEAKPRPRAPEGPEKPGVNSYALFFFVGCTTLAAAAFVTTCIVRSGHSGGASVSESGSGSSMDAFEMAKVFVGRKLVSPGSAEWASYTRGSVESLGAKMWRVRSWVDSQNGFGGLLRTNYSCTLSYTGNGNWHLESLDFN